jgi:hypothetical protein
VSLLYPFVTEARILNHTSWDARMKLLGMAAERKDIQVILSILGSIPYGTQRISAELSRAVIEVLVPKFRSSAESNQPGYGHHYFLSVLTRCLHASCYPLAIQCIGPQSVDSLHEDYQQFFREYQERYEIYQELMS